VLGISERTLQRKRARSARLSPAASDHNGDALERFHAPQMLIAGHDQVCVAGHRAFQIRLSSWSSVMLFIVTDGRTINRWGSDEPVTPIDGLAPNLKA